MTASCAVAAGFYHVVVAVSDYNIDYIPRPFNMLTIAMIHYLGTSVHAWLLMNPL